MILRLRILLCLFMCVPFLLGGTVKSVYASPKDECVMGVELETEENIARTSGYVDLTCPIRTSEIAAHVGQIRWTYYDVVTDTLHYLMECSGGPGTNGDYVSHTYITWDAY